MNDEKQNMEHLSRPYRFPKEVCLFNGFWIPFLPQLHYMMDGKPGMRTLFITDETEKIIISFEQGMKCLDTQGYDPLGRETTYAEYRQGNKYLHQRKVLAEKNTVFMDMVYFHMEVPDMDGMVHVCPGQMSVDPALRSEDGAEPVLKQLLDGIAVCKGGG